MDGNSIATQKNELVFAWNVGVVVHPSAKNTKIQVVERASGGGKRTFSAINNLVLDVANGYIRVDNLKEKST